MSSGQQPLRQLPLLQDSESYHHVVIILDPEFRYCIFERLLQIHLHLFERSPSSIPDLKQWRKTKLQICHGMIHKIIAMGKLSSYRVIGEFHAKIHRYTTH